jgi:hypothetical protein
MTIPRWEYGVLSCAPMTGLDDVGVRLSYQLATADQVRHQEIRSDDPSPVAAIARLLNDLGAEGWELVAYDTTTNRGVFKRLIPEPEAHDAA